MLVSRGLLLQIKCLKYSGFLSCSYRNNSTSSNDYSKVFVSLIQRLFILLVFIVLNGILLVSTIICAITPESFDEYSHSRTGSTSDYIYFLMTGFVQLTINFFMYFGRDINLAIIDKIFYLKTKYSSVRKDSASKDPILSSFELSVLFCVICVLNAFVLCKFTLTGSLKLFFLQSLIYMFQVYYDGMICTFYRSLVSLIKEILTSINERIEQKMLNSSTELNVNLVQQMLMDRQEIVRLCEEDLSWFYGFAIILLLIPALMTTTTALFYMITAWDNFDWNFGNCVLVFLNGTIIWTAPSFIYPVIIFFQNLEEEANKTARILSRISRRGTGMDKMVDKFLIKNIQQKPILTAYGFFPLNKRTLFKTFAAIFTYMVILIQFKDMENTSKLLTGTQATKIV